MTAGPGLDPKPSFYVNDNLSFKDNHSEFGESEISEMSRFSFDARNGNISSRDDVVSPIWRHKKGSLSSISLPAEDFTRQRPGWPLLQTASSITQLSQEARKMSVVQWVMTLPHRSLSDVSESNSPTSYKTDDSLEGENGKVAEMNTISKLASWQELPKDLKLILMRNSVGCKVFSHDFLKLSTSNFSSGNYLKQLHLNKVSSFSSIYYFCLIKIFIPLITFQLLQEILLVKEAVILYTREFFLKAKQLQ